MWRKHLQAYKKILTSVAILFTANSLSFTDSLSMPSISKPTMPAISSPTLSQNFYKPGTRKPQTAEESKDKNKSTDPTNDDYNIYTNSDINVIIGNQSDKNSIPKLNASDIETLGNLGLLDSLGMGSKTASPLSAFNKLMGNSNSLIPNITYPNNQKQLEEILKELETIKNTLKTNPTAAATVEAKQAQTKIDSSEPVPSRNPVVKNPKILRWQVNGYNILRTCSKVYFSEIQENKNFLLTGDRAYMSNGKQFKETFYMLFTAEGNRNGTGQYSVETNISQEYDNPSSFVYQISKMNKLNATKTGNLVLIRTTDPKFKLDMLIDIAQ